MTVSHFICTLYPRCVHTLYNVFYPIRGWQRYGDILFSTKFYPRHFYVILLDYPRSAYSFRSFQRIITKNKLNIQSLLAHSVRSISKLYEINRISEQSTKCHFYVRRKYVELWEYCERGLNLFSLFIFFFNRNIRINFHDSLQHDNVIER